jgi:hypothetical protein
MRTHRHYGRGAEDRLRQVAGKEGGHLLAEVTECPLGCQPRLSLGLRGNHDRAVVLAAFPDDRPSDRCQGVNLRWVGTLADVSSEKSLDMITALSRCSTKAPSDRGRRHGWVDGTRSSLTATTVR